MLNKNWDEPDTAAEAKTFLQASTSLIFDIVLVAILLLGLWAIEELILHLKLPKVISDYFGTAHILSSGIIVTIFAAKSVAIMAITAWRQICKY